MNWLRYSPQNPYKSPSPSLKFRISVGVVIFFLVLCGYFVQRDSIGQHLKGTATHMYTTTKEITPPYTIKVMSFNLRYASAKDGINSWDYRKYHLFNLIDRYRPVVMGTQEGLHDQLVEISENLKRNYRMFGVEREKKGEYSSIFYDYDLVELLHGGNFWLSDTPDVPGSKTWGAACVRMVTWCHFRVRSNSKEFYFFNTQFDHVSEEAREKSAVLLSEKIAEIAIPQLPLFIVGDFNTNRDTAAWQYLTGELGPGVLDAWLHAQRRVGEVSYTYHAWNGILHEDGSPVASNHIDWILYRPHTMTILKTEVITEDMDGRYPSDHYPVQSEIVFPVEVNE